jgi:hypothetical protein
MLGLVGVLPFLVYLPTVSRDKVEDGLSALGFIARNFPLVVSLQSLEGIVL